jgi:predicted nucleotidyltransferase
MANAVTRADLRKMAAHQRRAQSKRLAERKERLTKARLEVKRLVHSLLSEEPDITAIILFGSVARGDVSSPDFDIDLGVRCPPERFLRLFSAVSDSSFHVDLVDLDAVDNKVQRSIRREGVVLHEK